MNPIIEHIKYGLKKDIGCILTSKNFVKMQKKMYNVVNFYIRQVYTALTKDKDWQPLQKEVMNCLHKYIDRMNDVQVAAYRKKLEKENSKPIVKRKEVKCNLFELPSKQNPYINYGFLDSLFKVAAQPDYRSLPTQSSQAVMKKVFQNWKSFFSSIKEYGKNPSKFTGKPKIPKYMKSSQKEIEFTNQDCVIKDQKYLKFPLTKLQLNIGKLGCVNGKLKQVRVIPQYGHFVIEIVQEIELEKRELNPNHYMGIDLGLNNLATIVTNTGMIPVLLKGQLVKSINQYYNKKKAYYMGILRHGKNPKEGPFTSKRLEKLHLIRYRKMKDIFHKVSYRIVKIALREKVGTIIIGQNRGWKQEIGIGKRNNQAFCHVPHQMLINMITYKAEQYGMNVQVNEESYTSQASFLDRDEIPTYGEDNEKKKFSGKRLARGLYRSLEGLLINADVNGGGNILRKAVPNAFADGIEALFVSTPLALSVH